MCAARDERERRLKGQAAETAQREQERRAGDRRRFEALVLTEADRKGVLSKVEAAFEAGQREVMLVSFPSDFCTDGGRRVNNRLPGWQDTLPGGARGRVARLLARGAAAGRLRVRRPDPELPGRRAGRRGPLRHLAAERRLMA